MTYTSAIKLGLLLTLSSSFAFASGGKCVNVFNSQMINAGTGAIIVTTKKKPVAIAETTAIDLDSELKIDDGSGIKLSDVQPAKTEVIPKLSLDEASKLLSDLGKDDVEKTKKSFDYLNKQLKLSQEVSVWRKLGGDSLHVLEFKWLVDEYILKRSLKNGYNKQIFNKYRDLFRSTEKNFMVLLRNLHDLKVLQAQKPVDQKKIDAILKENKKVIKGSLYGIVTGKNPGFARQFMEYRSVRRLLDAIKILGDTTTTDVQKEDARRLLGRSFAEKVEADPDIVSRAIEIEKGLHITSIKSNLELNKLPEGIFDLELMQHVFETEDLGVFLVFLKSAVQAQQIDTIQKVAIDKPIRENLAKFVSKFPENSKMGRFLKFILSYDETALKQREYLQDVSEVLSSTGKVEDKTELLFEKSAADMEGNNSRTELQTLLFVHSTGVVTKRVQLVRTVHSLITGKDKQVIMQKTDSPLSPEEKEQEQFKTAYDKLNDQTGKKSLVTLKDSQRSHIIDSRTVNANDFLVYMYRLVHTQPEWIAIKEHLEKQSDAKSLARLDNIKTAELVGNELGEIALVHGKPVILWKAIAAGLASPWIGDKVVDSIVYLYNLTPFIGN